MQTIPVFTLERKIDAPVDLVWRTWTEPELLEQWYGPNVETIVHKLDVRPGGLWFNEMKMGGQSHYQRTEFTEVTPPNRLVCLTSESDANWKVTPSPMMANWPKFIETKVTLDECDGKTALTLTWLPHGASEPEIAAFEKGMGGAVKGWEMGMDLMEKVAKGLISKS